MDHTTITCKSIPEAYHRAVWHIWNHGIQRVDERGDEIRELLDFKIVIPGDNCSHCGTGLREIQENDFAQGLIDPEKAAKKGKDFIYAYGERLWNLNQLEKTIQRIIKEPITRRAVLPIFDKIDNCMTINEVPCWITGQFILRDNKLNAQICFRSNDIYGAFPADCYGIRKLQEWAVMRINESLGESLVSMGYYSHTVGSAHVLLNDEAGIKSLLGV